MDKEQEEIQFLGFFSIFKESFQIISSWRKIFTQLTLSLILPLSFIYLAHIQISEYLFTDIIQEESLLDETPQGTRSYSHISDVLSSEWTGFFLFKIAYFVFFLVLALSSTSAVVYTIACIYTAKEISFKKILGVVPKVWKRLLVTFIWDFIIVFVYNMIALIIMALWILLMGFAYQNLGAIGGVVFIILVVLYIVGFIYISVIWHLASVVSVLEDVYGLQAMVKSKELIKGKMGIAVVFFFLLGSCLFTNQVVFEKFVVNGYWNGLVKIGFGVVCLVVQSILMLFGLIIQTIIYFVCKSYHHENIDKSLLADHLEVYLGDYVPLKSKDVQLEQFEV